MKKLICLLLGIMSSCLILAQNNCPASTICTSTGFTLSGSGIQELTASNRGCLGIEHNSVWLQVTIQTSGTFTFDITPNVSTNDFDFGIWGSGSTCPPITSPIRCSYHAGGGNTGLNSTQTDVSEGAVGGGPSNDGFVAQLNVTAGQIYLILVDNFTSNQGFSMSFGGTSTLSCTPLPIELTEFNCLVESEDIQLHWITATETNNRYFDIKRSNNALNWVKIGQISGNGTTSILHEYQFYDYFPEMGENYYRLVQVDYNGKESYSNIIECTFSSEIPYIIVYYDMQGRQVDINNCKSGVYIRKFINEKHYKVNKYCRTN